MPEIRVSFQPQLREVLHAARLYEGAIFKTWDRLAALLFASLSGLYLVRGSPIVAAVWGTLALVEWFNVLPFSVLAAYIQFKKNPTYRQFYDLTLSPDGLRVQTKGITSMIEWNLYSRYWETDRAFVLSYGFGLPTVIPKSAFASAADLEATRALLSDVILVDSTRGAGVA